MRVAYLGPPGTVSDEALTAAAPDADAVALSTLRDVVLSCIAHRDNARLYSKVVKDGRGEHELSPEEDEAIRLALAGEPSRTVTLD